MERHKYLKDYESLMAEYDYSKNMTIDYSTITHGSNKILWWKCNKGHEWQCPVVRRTMGSKCPFCTNVRVLAGFNDLQTTNPELASEWNYSKNTELPTEVFEKGRKTVWWVCRKGHEWQAPLYSRATGIGCPICNAETKTSFPEQAVYFYLSKLYKAESRAIVFGKEIDVFLREYSIGIEYDGKYYHQLSQDREFKKDAYLSKKGVIVFRIKETKDKSGYDGDRVFFCPYSKTSYKYLERTIALLIQVLQSITINYSVLDIDISRDEIEIREQYLKSEKQNSIVVKDPKTKEFWDADRNGKIKIEYVNYGTPNKYWWKCPECGNSWRREPIKMLGKGCPYCNGTILSKGVNDLETKYPSLLKEWDYTANELQPNSYCYSSNKKVHWICPQGHKYVMTVYHRTVRNQGCPVCRNKEIIRYVNDLATLNPNLASEWDYKRNNELKPWMVSVGTRKRVWWKCSVCGYEWQAYIYNRNRGDKCPKCSKDKQLERMNAEKIAEYGSLQSKYPELIEEWIFEKNEKLGLIPSNILPGSHKKAWWRCKKCGKEWLAVIGNRTKGHGCSSCNKRRKDDG